MKAAQVLAFSKQAATVGEALWGALVRIDGGVAMVATVTEPRAPMLLVPGGEQDAGELVVRIQKTVLAERPGLQGLLEWKRSGETEWRKDQWQVEVVTGEAVDACWVVRCIPRN